MERITKLARGNARERIHLMCAFLGTCCWVRILTGLPLDERLQGPLIIPLNHINLSRANSKSGVAQLAWNSNGSLLLVRFGSYFTAPLCDLRLTRPTRVCPDCRLHLQFPLPPGKVRATPTIDTDTYAACATRAMESCTERKFCVMLRIPGRIYLER